MSDFTTNVEVELLGGPLDGQHMTAPLYHDSIFTDIEISLSIHDPLTPGSGSDEHSSIHRCRYRMWNHRPDRAHYQP